MPAFGTQMFGSGGAAYEIEKSCRFNYADSPYLQKTGLSGGNQRTWTFSTWTVSYTHLTLPTILLV